ncbi:MAG: methylenetetrahydrofolate dehydrogenase / methenyltetrahydrofolate cyclohydrolase [Candidatus Parcubacteria bacterium]|jgi:methylenetetrahydrofolate dehydrogenase (NADP+)/methenyltetrahydrofolate cyclohydrolase|nr:methylenetetrahydrofolate dehydrogenase / methenyltetrahydrofolate cyclohydrolase [Candidatus Parcubacteria bacterium]
MTTILDGRAARQALLPDLRARIQKLREVPTLAIIQVGDRPDSTSFIQAKKQFAEQIGVKENHIQLPESVTEEVLIDTVLTQNAERSVRGIIVQLPLPLKIDRDAVIDAIDHKKDVDGLSPLNVKRWLEGREDAVMPATARGIRQLLKHYEIELFGKHVTVIGRSMLVGKPIIAMCLNENASVTICHSKTSDLLRETKEADLIIVAAGKPGLITAKYVKKGQIIVDVGINSVSGEKLDDEIEGLKLMGDVDFESVKEKVHAITPVPGGVGPMTVLALFQNLIDLCERGS